MKNDEMPLTEADYTAVRKSVMAKIAAGEQRRRAFRPLQLAFVGVCFAIVIALLIPKPAAVVKTEGTRPEARPVQVAQQPRNPATQQLATQQPQPPRPHIIAKRHRHHREKTTEIAAATNMRLELMTSDPDIHIIWITNATPNESR